MHYAIAVNAASSRVEEAKALGAEQLAPYEYYFATEHLRQAQIEAGEASYSDAANLAEEAEEYANTAIELTPEGAADAMNTRKVGVAPDGARCCATRLRARAPPCAAR